MSAIQYYCIVPDSSKLVFSRKLHRSKGRKYSEVLRHSEERTLSRNRLLRLLFSTERYYCIVFPCTRYSVSCVHRLPRIMNKREFLQEFGFHADENSSIAEVESIFQRLCDTDALCSDTVTLSSDKIQISSISSGETKFIQNSAIKQIAVQSSREAILIVTSSEINSANSSAKIVQNSVAKIYSTVLSSNEIVNHVQSSATKIDRIASSSDNIPIAAIISGETISDNSSVTSSECTRSKFRERATFRSCLAIQWIRKVQRYSDVFCLIDNGFHFSYVDKSRVC